MILTAIAIGLTLLSVLSRPDSEDELVEDCGFAVVVVAPLWAAVAFLFSRGRRNSPWRVVIFAFIAYLLFGCSLVAIQIVKHRIRSGGWRGKPTASVSEATTYIQSSTDLSSALQGMRPG